MKKIEFVSYDGKYPNLCAGVLTLRIEDNEYTFGWHRGARYPQFWTAGGTARFDENWEPTLENGPYTFDYSEMPGWLTTEEKEYIGELFNSNVEWGRCGGCL